MIEVAAGPLQSLVHCNLLRMLIEMFRIHYNELLNAVDRRRGPERVRRLPVRIFKVFDGAEHLTLQEAKR